MCHEKEPGCVCTSKYVEAELFVEPGEPLLQEVPKIDRVHSDVDCLAQEEAPRMPSSV